MRYLFIIQGDGRGHMTQALALANILRRNGHEVAEVLLGKSKSRETPAFFQNKINAPITTFSTFSFIFDKENKNVNMFRTAAFNLNPKTLRTYLKSLKFMHERIEAVQPDVVISFYEILVGFYHMRYKTNIPFISIAHQFITEHPDFNHSNAPAQAYFILRTVTQMTNKGSDKTLALSMYPMRDVPDKKLYVVPPLLRDEVLQLKPTTGNYILGYMLNQGYEAEIREWHDNNKDVKLKFFWDKKEASKELVVDDTLTLYTIDDEKFLHFMENCKGYITTAGFESVCEALYLDKAVMLIPAHVEQQVNAADAASFAGCVVGDSFNMTELIQYIDRKEPSDGTFKKWVDSAEEVFIKYLTKFP